jgi:SWI/SNF-related matrix-associated actin-dependent regulator 1 of chromatin subfamily A
VRRGGTEWVTVAAHGKPGYLPFAALPWVEYADESATLRLEPLLAEYRASFALEDPGDPLWMPDGESLMPFQAAGVRYALRRQHTLIADPMGLGKTVQALAVCNATEARRILVVCPAAITRQWRDAAMRWLRPLRSCATHGVVVVNGMRIHPTARVVVISYDRAKQPAISAALGATEWDAVILDEAHYLRNHSSARAKHILGSWAAGRHSGILGRASRVIALTGTPLPNRPLEIYGLARALDWESIDFMSFDAFKEAFNKYEIMQVTKQDGTIAFVRSETVSRLEELQARLRCGFMVRRDKAAAAPQMPAKIYDVLDVGSRQLEVLVQRERLLDIDIDHLDTLTFEQQAAVASIRREMGLEMASAAKEVIEDMIESDGKIVVFCWHLDVVAKLAELFAHHKPQIVTGQHSASQRETAVKTFVEDNECRLFIGNIQAAGTGIDGLQRAACSLVILEPSWVPAENEQAIDRLHRVGQANPVLARFLVAEGSISARIIRRAVEKARVAHCALDSAGLIR